MTVIDVHTHMFTRSWLAELERHGAPHYEVGKTPDGRDCVRFDGAQFLTPVAAHFDYAMRVRDMDAVGVDVAIVSLTAPNCYFGAEEVSTRAARLVNDDMAEAQKAHPDRIRWLASLPWEYPASAVAELRRAWQNGAVGVMVLANINGRSLTEEAFAPVWRAVDELALPVLVHPTAPPGTQYLDVKRHNLVGSVGFIFDTSLAITRMVFDGFFDVFPRLKIIASHAGGALPYIVGRLDRCHEMDPDRRTKISVPPSEYLQRIYYDAVTYRVEALKLCLDVGGPDKLMYGSDYPHGIGDMKGCLARVRALPSGNVKAVSSENARRLFKL